MLPHFIYLAWGRPQRPRANLVQTLHTVEALDKAGTAVRLYTPPVPRHFDMAGFLAGMGIRRPIDIHPTALLHRKWGARHFCCDISAPACTGAVTARFLSLANSVRAQTASTRDVRQLAAVGVLFSMTDVSMMGEVIIRDGIIYVKTAQAYLDGGLEAAIAVYNWPGYSILFGLISQSTGLSLEASARLLNTVFMLLLVDAFIRLCSELDRDSPRPWIAALVVLSFPPLNHRLEIHRDWGSLAFSLCAIVPLLRFWLAERGRLRDPIKWQMYIAAALLLRIEHDLDCVLHRADSRPREGTQARRSNLALAGVAGLGDQHARQPDSASRL